MNKHFKNFFRDCYMQTSGFIPAKPFGQFVFPGDFFQVRNGEMIILGNIFRNSIVDPADAVIVPGVKLHHSGWHFGSGVSKPYSGRGHGKVMDDGHFEYSRQKLAFEKAGSFFFKGNQPESLKITNWNQLQQECIIKLTQTVYSFRELYVITETATTSDWTLAVAGVENADLEIATDSENFGLSDIFGHHSAKTVQMHGVDYYHRETERKPSFYKAKKLVLQDERLDTFVSELIEERWQQRQWAAGFFKYDFPGDSIATAHVPMTARASLLDMMQANELNPNTALRYFKWADASLDDVEKFFPGYGHE